MIVANLQLRTNMLGAKNNNMDHRTDMLRIICTIITTHFDSTRKQHSKPAVYADAEYSVNDPLSCGPSPLVSSPTVFSVACCRHRREFRIPRICRGRLEFINNVTLHAETRKTDMHGDVSNT